MRDKLESLPEHKIIINIVDGLADAEGACEQLTHRHGDGNLKFQNLGQMITGMKKAISSQAVIPIFNEIKPHDPTGPVVYDDTLPQETPIIDHAKDGEDAQVVLATGTSLCAGGAGADAINQSSADGGDHTLAGNGSAREDGGSVLQEGSPDSGGI